MNRLLKIGGEQLDSAIANLVRHSKDFIIGRPTAERLRKEFEFLTSPPEVLLLYTAEI